MNLVINYAVIGFRPYEEIGEFINVGVLAVEGKSRFLSYKLLSPQRTKRIRSAFSEIDMGIYRDGIRRIEGELATLAIETNRWSDDSGKVGKNNAAQLDLFHEDGNNDLFRHLTAQRSSPFFFAEKGTRLTGDVDTEVEELFKRYVEHWNLTPVDYEEKKLTRDLRTLLRGEKLERMYREAPWVGTDAYHVRIPLAFQPVGHNIPLKAIKPLNLAQSTPTRIYTHGDDWIAKVRRLKRIKCLPKNFLFAVRKPVEPETRDAAVEICEGLKSVGVEVADVDDSAAILAFAKIEEDPDLKLKSH